MIKASEANKQQQINEAEGQAAAILAVATATAEGLRRVGSALSDRGGIEAMQLRIGEEYVRQDHKSAFSHCFAVTRRGIGRRVGTRDIAPPLPHKKSWKPVVGRKSALLWRAVPIKVRVYGVASKAALGDGGVGRRLALGVSR